jgi:hypothetical protein
VFLQFNDPLAREAIRLWAENMDGEGFYQLHDDVIARLDEYDSA